MRKKRDVRRTRAKPKLSRETFQLDEVALNEISDVRVALRAANKTETVRRCIQLVAQLLKHVSRGAWVAIVPQEQIGSLPAGAVLVEVLAERRDAA